MNMTLLRRGGILFTLVCVAALATHPGAVLSKSVASKTGSAAFASTAAADPAPAADDHPATPSDRGDFDDEQSADQNDRLDGRDRHERRHRGHGHGERSLVSIGHSSHLLAGEKADSVVSVLGSSTNEGEAQDVVSVIGSTRVTGPVRDSAVAVLGNNYVNSKVDGDVVAVLGNVELGPEAEVGGDVVAVLGRVDRDPAAIVHGSVQRVLDVDLGGIHGFGWLDTWIHRCLLYGRPLAVASGLGWAWTLALGLLAFYACLALMFRSSVDQCVQTLERQPGHAALAALIAILLTPVLLVLLCVTLIGIAAVPVVVAALFCMSLFGKAVVLAWLGGRISNRRPGPAGHPAVAVLIGGAVVLVLYVIPVVGFLVYKLLGFFGFGAVVYTLLVQARARRAAISPPPSSPPAFAGASATPAGPAPAMAGPGWTSSAAPSAALDPEPVQSSAGPPPAGMPPQGPPRSTSAPAAASPQFSASLPRAGFWVRMAALLLDVLLVGFVMSLLHPFGNTHLVVLAIYGAVMWKLRGSTVGGIVFDLHVVRMDGRAVDWETAIVRALGCFLSLFVVFLGFIWIAFDHDNQAWHDKIAGTVVVHVPRGTPLV